MAEGATGSERGAESVIRPDPPVFFPHEGERVMPRGMSGAFGTLSMSLEDGKKYAIRDPEPPDPFGLVRVFAEHLQLSSKDMHPVHAAKAASAAVENYLASHDFVEVGTKESGTPEYRMMPKRPEKR